LVLGIVVYGGLAIWIEIGKYLNADHSSMEGIRLAILTYFPAVGCAAGQQISVYEESRSYMRQFGNIVSVTFLLLCIVGFWLQERHPILSLVVAILSSISAVVVAWIAIGMDRPFDEADPDAPVGGNTNTPLSGTTGEYVL
jgi:hypothetical protein